MVVIDAYGPVAIHGPTGATAATRYVGATASGAPASGTFAVGDFAVAQDAHIFVCTVAGSPGTWTDVGFTSSAVSSVFGRTGAVVATTGDYYGVVASALTGATQASRYVGSTTSGAPASGTFAVGDYIVARDGHMFVCTAAGTPGTWADVGAGASGISQLTGDVTAGPGSGSQAATLATSGVTAGTYGDGSHSSQVTVDAKGRVTAASSVAIGTGVGLLAKCYDFTITGSDQAAIDTSVDGTVLSAFSGFDLISVICLARTDAAAAQDSVDFFLNNDTSGGHYTWTRLSPGGQGSAVNANGFTPIVHGSGGTASYASQVQWEFLNSGSTFDRTGNLRVSTLDQTTGNIDLRTLGWLWQNTAQVTRIKMQGSGTSKLKVGSRMVIYGQ